MPEIPFDVVEAGVIAMVRYLAQDEELESPAPVARAILEAAAPLLAQHVAAAIEAHGRQHFGADKPGPAAVRRHLRIAASIAAGAFDTEEDQVRKINEAVERGNFIACKPFGTEED